jgi:hypothetical protein
LHRNCLLKHVIVGKTEGKGKGGRQRKQLLEDLNPLTPELNPSAQRCLPRFLLGILIFKGLTARRLYKSFGVKGLKKIEDTGN